MIEGQRLSGEQGGQSHGCRTLPRSFHAAAIPFRPGCRLLRGPVPSHFENFYRANLRFVPGSRLKSSAVNSFYNAWATATGATSMSNRELKRAMHNIGHGCARSNGIWFRDVALSAECDDLADNFPGLPTPPQAHAAALADRLDRMITELASIRAHVSNSADTH